MSICAPPRSGGSRRRRRSDRHPSPPRPELIQLWRRQIGCRLRLGEERGPRPFVLIGYQCRGRGADTLIPISQLTFFSLFDERTEDDRPATRLLGFRPTLTVEGVQIGGALGNVIDKDLRLPPAAAGGRRLDAADADFVEMALGLERLLERCSRHPHYPRRASLRFPQWWCEAEGDTRGLPNRRFNGRELVETESALGRRLRIQEVFADLAQIPKRQVLACPNPRHVLCGTSGETTFDLYTSRFRRAP